MPIPYLPPSSPVAKVDGRIWMTIPDMASMVGVKTAEFSFAMTTFNLQRKGGSYGRSFPTRFAIDNGYVIRVDVGKDQDLTRWNYPKIIKLFNASSSDA